MRQNSIFPRTGNKMEFFKRKVGDFLIVLTTFSFSILRKDCGGGLSDYLGGQGYMSRSFVILYLESVIRIV